MRKLAPILIVAALVLVGAGCSSSNQQANAVVSGAKVTTPAQVNAYPGTEPYIAPTAPPPQPK
jgi:uncharacterized protein YcfL